MTNPWHRKVRECGNVGPRKKFQNDRKFSRWLHKLSLICKKVYFFSHLISFHTWNAEIKHEKGYFVFKKLKTILNRIRKHALFGRKILDFCACSQTWKIISMAWTNHFQHQKFFNIHLSFPIKITVCGTSYTWVFSKLHFTLRMDVTSWRISTSVPVCQLCLFVVPHIFSCDLSHLTTTGTFQSCLT